LTSIARESERAVLVFGALLPLLIAVAFLVAELVGGIA
jgi:hypothetical protein